MEGATLWLEVLCAGLEVTVGEVTVDEVTVGEIAVDEVTVGGVAGVAEAVDVGSVVTCAAL